MERPAIKPRAEETSLQPILFPHRTGCPRPPVDVKNEAVRFLLYGFFSLKIFLLPLVHCRGRFPPVVLYLRLLFSPSAFFRDLRQIFLFFSRSVFSFFIFSSALMWFGWERTLVVSTSEVCRPLLFAQTRPTPIDFLSTAPFCLLFASVSGEQSL